eukprot:1160028-Pelagomonas_calceolata.AAC.3
MSCKPHFDVQPALDWGVSVAQPDCCPPAAVTGLSNLAGSSAHLCCSLTNACHLYLLLAPARISYNVKACQERKSLSVFGSRAEVCKERKGKGYIAVPAYEGSLAEA